MYIMKANRITITGILTALLVGYVGQFSLQEQAFGSLRDQPKNDIDSLSEESSSESQDKVGSFEIQDLMSTYNQATTLAGLVSHFSS